MKDYNDPLRTIFPKRYHGKFYTFAQTNVRWDAGVRWRQVHERILTTRLPCVEPLYTEAVTHSKRALDALEKNNPYEFMSNAFTSLVKYAYAAQLYQIVECRRGWLYRWLPLSPFEIEVKPDTLPDCIVEGIVRYVEEHVCKCFEDLFKKLDNGASIFTHNYIRSLPLHIIIVCSKHKKEIEQSIHELNIIVEKMKKHAGTKNATWCIPLSCRVVFSPRTRECGYREVHVCIASGRHEGTVFDKFKTLLTNLGFSIYEGRLAELHWACARKCFGSVELQVCCDSRGRGFMTVSLTDIEAPIIPINIGAPTILENVILKPHAHFRKSHVKPSDSKAVFTRKVQANRNELFLNLTEPLEILGVKEGDFVEIRVDVAQRLITISPIPEDKSSV